MADHRSTGQPAVLRVKVQTMQQLCFPRGRARHGNLIHVLKYKGNKDDIVGKRYNTLRLLPIGCYATHAAGHALYPRRC